MKQRTLPKSISCGKTFRNHTALHTVEEVRHWLGELAQELEERVIEDRKANARLPQLLTVSFYTPPEGQGTMSGQGKGPAGNGPVQGKGQVGTGPGQGKGQAGNGPGQGRGQEYWQGGTSISRSCHLRKATASCMGDDATVLVTLHMWRLGLHADQLAVKLNCTCQEMYVLLLSLSLCSSVLHATSEMHTSCHVFDCWLSDSDEPPQSMLYSKSSRTFSEKSCWLVRG